MEKKLERDEQHKMIAGVCSGLANYLSVDITIIRAVFVISMILHGSGIIPYIILWIVMPKKKFYGFGQPGFAPGVDYTVPPQNGPVDYSVPSGFGAAPIEAPRRKRDASIIVGLALVTFGAFFLLDNFNLLPDWDFERLWPVVLIALGVLLVFTRREAKPWEKADWQATEQPATEIKTEEKTEDTPPTE